eukprot:SAG22_NODE_2868_length_2140_cov_1.193043_2_plen_141_part_00
MFWPRDQLLTAARDRAHRIVPTAAAQVTKLTPDRWNGWATKGDALISMGRFTEAKTAYERALLLEPRRDELVRSYSRAAAMAAASARQGVAEPEEEEITPVPPPDEPDVIIPETEDRCATSSAARSYSGIEHPPRRGPLS